MFVEGFPFEVLVVGVSVAAAEEPLLFSSSKFAGSK